MHNRRASTPLWHFPVTAMPDAPPEPLDPMELIARWQAETESRAASTTRRRATVKTLKATARRR
jgi:hypothetical protein